MARVVQHILYAHGAKGTEGSLIENPSDSPDDEPTDTTAPGFGVIVALVALIAAALVAVRRSN